MLKGKHQTILLCKSKKKFSFLFGNRNTIKRQADEDSTSDGDFKRLRLDDDISEETVTQILAVINDPKKMLGPEVS